MEQNLILPAVAMICTAFVVCSLIWAITIGTVVSSLAPYLDHRDEDEE